MTTLRELSGKHDGADIFVCGTGTSLASFDWSALDGLTTIALNDAISARGFAPTYHLWVDAGLYGRYIRRYPQTIAVVPQDTAFLLEGDYADVATCTHVKRYDRVRGPVCDPRWPAPEGRLVLPTAAVEPDSDQLFANHTVATAGVQLAWRLGARRIYLLGCDAYTREQDGKGNYWDGRRSAEMHRKPQHVGGGRYRTTAHIFWDMEMTRLGEWFAELGVYNGPWPMSGVYNCSEESTLTAWEKVDLEIAIKEAHHDCYTFNCGT